MENDENDLSQIKNVEFNDHKSHYDSLVKLFKYSLGMFLFFVSGVGGIIGWITYSDGKELKAEMEKRNTDFQTNIKEMNNKSLEIHKDMLNLIRTTREDISLTRQQAIDQINVIREESIIIAKGEARKRIDQVFEENNVEDFIVSVTKQKLEPKIEATVEDKIRLIDEIKFERAISNMISGDEIQQELALLYFQRADPLEWSTNQLQLIIDQIRKIEEGNILKFEVCIYLGLTNSSLVNDFFRKELSSNPTGDVGEFAFSYLLKNGDNESLANYYEAYLKIPIEKRLNFFTNMIRSSREKTILMECLNYQELISQVKVDYEILAESKPSSSDSFKNVIERELKARSITPIEFESTYFHSKFQ